MGGVYCTFAVKRYDNLIRILLCTMEIHFLAKGVKTICFPHTCITRYIKDIHEMTPPRFIDTVVARKYANIKEYYIKTFPISDLNLATPWYE